METNSPVQAEITATSLRHGADSEIILSTVTEEIAEYLFAECPWILEYDLVAIDQYCRTEARLRLLTAYMEQIIDEKGIDKVPPFVWTEITRAETNAYRRADSLGLSPEGRMKIAKDSGMAQHFSSTNVSDLKDRGRALRAAG
jgi:hypothetical protein